LKNIPVPFQVFIFTPGRNTDTGNEKFIRKMTTIYKVEIDNITPKGKNTGRQLK